MRVWLSLYSSTYESWRALLLFVCVCVCGRWPLSHSCMYMQQALQAVNEAGRLVNTSPAPSCSLPAPLCHALHDLLAPAWSFAGPLSPSSLLLPFYT